MKKGQVALPITVILSMLLASIGGVVYVADIKGDTRLNARNIEHNTTAIVSVTENQEELRERITELRILTEVLVKDRGYNPTAIIRQELTQNHATTS